MNKMQQRQDYRVGVGASSILMIFIILCLTTLGVLSFASARANLQLTNRRQVQVEAYYAAEAEAQRLLAQVDAALLKARGTPDVPQEDAVKALAALDERITVARDLTVHITIHASESQDLCLTLRVNDVDVPARYTLIEHYLINIEEWEPDNTLDLMV